MLRLLADENFNHDIVRGLLLKMPQLDILYAQDHGLSGADDPTVLAWASDNNRVLLTHDRATMPTYAYQRLAAGEKMTGLFVLHSRFPVGLAIEEILLLAQCTIQSEWDGHVVYLPL